MHAENNPVFRRIRQVSTILMPVLFLTVLSITWMIVMVTWWVMTSPTATGEHFFRSTIGMGVQPQQIIDGLLTARDKRMLMTVMAGVLFLIMPGLYFAIRLVQNFRRTEIFSSRNVIYARRIATLFLIFMVLGTLSGLVTSWHAGEGFALSFNPLLFSKNWIILSLLWLFVWVMDIGRALKLDSDMTI